MVLIGRRTVVILKHQEPLMVKTYLIWPLFTRLLQNIMLKYIPMLVTNSLALRLKCMPFRQNNHFIMCTSLQPLFLKLSLMKPLNTSKLPPKTISVCSMTASLFGSPCSNSFSCQVRSTIESFSNKSTIFPWPVTTMTLTNIQRSSCTFSSLLVLTCLWQMFMHTGTTFTNRSRSILLLGFDNTSPPRLSRVTTSFAPKSLTTWKISQKIVLIFCLILLSNVVTFTWQ